MNKNFEGLGLSGDVLKSIETLGFEKPSKIQEQLIPLIMNGEDVIGQAQTGTGKTLAYAASILSKIGEKTKDVKAIVLTPTRELALQVGEEFKTLNTSSSYSVLSVYGGSSIEDQIKKLKRGVDIVIGTPGRILDLMKRKVLTIEELEFFVLDEADEMLNMGFFEDIETIFKKSNANKQVLLLSATMPKQIKKLAENYMKTNYKHVVIESDSKTSINVEQSYYLVNEKTRLEALCRLLDIKDSHKMLIFCQTKKDCDQLLYDLTNRKYSAEVMHGDISQSMRIQTLEKFKKDNFRILIATDVAARGIHVDNIECVVNYRLPQEFESYIHRIGRTGRAASHGEAISLVSVKEIRLLKSIEKFVNSTIIQKELPTAKDIVSKKYEQILNTATEEIEDKGYLEAMEYLRDYNKDDLLKLSASLLKVTVNQSLGSNLTKDIDVKETQRERDDRNRNDRDRGDRNDRGRNRKGKRDATKTRLFITIGKKDDLTKESLIDFIKETTGVEGQSVQNIEIMSTFTFMDVDNDKVKDLEKKLHNQKYKTRIVRVEEANK